MSESYYPGQAKCHLFNQNRSTTCRFTDILGSRCEVLRRSQEGQRPPPAQQACTCARPTASQLPYQQHWPVESDAVTQPEHNSSDVIQPEHNSSDVTQPEHNSSGVIQPEHNSSQHK